MTPTRAVDALVLDYGGVVGEIDFGRVLAHWSAASGVPIETLAQRFHFDAAYRAHETGALDSRGYVAALRRTLGVTLDDERLLAGWNAVFVGEVEGMRTLLAALASHCPLYLFSNTNAAHARFFLREHAALLQPFRRLFLSHELGLRKPDAAAFAAVVEAIGLPAARIGFVDDTAENVAGAHAAGLQAFHVGSFSETRNACARLLALPLELQQ